jgi:hypothetical protein
MILSASWALAAFVPCASAAHAAEAGGWQLKAGTGVGAAYGLVGLAAEARYDFRTVGLSAGLGGPVIPSATLGLWLPGERFSFGLLASAGYQPLASTCGTDPNLRPQAKCHLTLAGANLVLDHDVGERGGLVLRYGLGFTLVGSGGGGFVVPFTFGLSWQW